MVDKFIRDIIDRKRHVVRHLLGSSSKTNINSFQLSFIFKITTSLFPKLHIFRQTFSSFLELKKAFYIVWFPTLYKVASTTDLPQESGETVTANKAQAAAQDKHKTDDGRHVNTFKQNKQRNQTSQITF